MLPNDPARLKAAFQQGLAAQKAGQFDAALAQFRQVLAVRPDLAEAQFQIGRIHAAQGDMAKAETALRKALKLRPKEPAIWAALAGILTGGKLKKLHAEAARAGVPLSGEPDISALIARIARGPSQAAGAEADALDLVRRYPDAAHPALALGAARAAQKKWSFALPALEKATERDPTSPMAHVLLGEVLLKLGQLSRSEAALEKARGLGADVSVPWAHLMHETCRDAEAEEVLARAVKAAPRDPRLAGEHAQALVALRRPQDALKVARKAIASGATRTNLLQLANAMLNEGDTGPALKITGEVLEKSPDSVPALTLRGQLLQTTGELEEGQAMLLRAAEISPDGAEAIRSYVGGAKLAEDDPILPILEARMGDAALPIASRRTLAFAMAKAQEDLGHYSDVFPHLHRANRLMKQEFPYRFENERTHVQAILDAYRGLKGRTPATDAPKDAPIFVTGMARSGTTLVETILAAHDRVTAGGELPYLSRALAPFIEAANTAPDRLPDLMIPGAQRYLQAARRRVGTDGIFTDKAISTYARIGLIAQALPNARFLILKRDPRDVGLSIYRNMFPPGSHLYSTDLADIGRFIRQHDAFVEFWQAEMPDRVHVVDYEALTAEPEPHIRALVAAAGLDWQDACLAPQDARRDVATLSFSQVRQPIYRASVAAWKRYEEELAPLIDALEQPVTL